MNFVVMWIWNLIGPKVALVLAVLGVGLLAYGSGYLRARANCQEAGLRSELATARADLEHSREAAKRSLALADKLTQAEQRNDELARKITGACVLQQRDIDGLLRIR